MQLTFSSRQAKWITSAITGLALLVLSTLVLLAFFTVIRFLSAFSPVFLPLAAAGILSLLLRPPAQYIQHKTKLPNALSVLLIFVLVMTPLAFLLHFFGLLLIRQLNAFLSSLPDLLDALERFIEKNLPALAVQIESVRDGDALRETLTEHRQPLLRLLRVGTGGLSHFLGAFSGLLGWLAMPVYLFFFMLAPPFRLDQFEQFLPFIKKETREDVLFLVRQFVEIVVTYFRGQFIVALIQGLILATGFSLAGLSNGFVLGMIFGLSNLIPYLGNILGLTVTLPLAYLQPDGGWGMLFAVLGVVIFTQTVESYWLTPKIIGNKTGLHPMAVIFAIFFWGQAIGGIFGLVLAVPLTAFLVVFWRLLREKYLPRMLNQSEKTESGASQPRSSA